ncbi:MAG: hypothetical protein PHT07_10210 [Paludibacter sp.]|nr:hypothetical protein [Paludibacter sp.]
MKGGKMPVMDGSDTYHITAIVPLSGKGKTIFNECLCQGIVDEVLTEIHQWHEDGEHSETLSEAIQNGKSIAELIEIAFEEDKDLFRNWRLDGGVEFFPMEAYGCYGAMYQGKMFYAPMKEDGSMEPEANEVTDPAEGFEQALKELFAKESLDLMEELSTMSDLELPEALEIIKKMLDAEVEIDFIYEEEGWTGTMRFNFANDTTRRVYLSEITESFVNAMHRIGVCVWDDKEGE